MEPFIEWSALYQSKYFRREQERWCMTEDLQGVQSLRAGRESTVMRLVVGLRFTVTRPDG